MPVRILGLKAVPQVGEILTVVHDKKLMKQKKKQYSTFGLQKMQEETPKQVVLNLILKADTLGSLEAIASSLEKLQVTGVSASVIHKGLGNVNENDLSQAEAAGAQVLAFNVGMTPGAQDYTIARKVTVSSFDVIYHLTEYVEAEMRKLRPSETILIKTGKLKVLAIFKATEKSRIFGGRVTEGSLFLNSPCKLFRNEKEVGEGTITQLQLEKKNVSEAPTNVECGVKMDTAVDVQVNDTLEAYKTEERQVD
jgi:translation initiation factor IF-2